MNSGRKHFFYRRCSLTTILPSFNTVSFSSEGASNQRQGLQHHLCHLLQCWVVWAPTQGGQGAGGQCHCQWQCLSFVFIIFVSFNGNVCCFWISAIQISSLALYSRKKTTYPKRLEKMLSSFQWTWSLSRSFFVWQIFNYQMYHF